MVVSVAKVLKQCTPITLHEILVENWMIGRFTMPELLKKLMTKDRRNFLLNFLGTDVKKLEKRAITLECCYGAFDFYILCEIPDRL